MFFLFAAIMNFVIDMHIKEMDNCEHGIMGRMMTLNRYLKVADLELWRKMEEENILPHYYSFRWLALLLAQEFALNDTIKVWDFLLSYDGTKRFFLLYSLCVAILKIRKPSIMSGDFITTLPLIQKLRDLEVDGVIKLGLKLYEKYHRVNMDKLFLKLN